MGLSNNAVLIAKPTEKILPKIDGAKAINNAPPNLVISLITLGKSSLILLTKGNNLFWILSPKFVTTTEPVCTALLN